MQITTTMRYHLTPVRMTIINKPTTSAGKDVEKGEHFCTVGGSSATVESSMELPQKIKNGSAFRPRNSTSGTLFEGTKTLIQKNINIPMFNAVLFAITMIWKPPKCPIVNEQIKQLWGHLHNGILLSCKKEENVTLCDSMDRCGEHYAK